MTKYSLPLILVLFVGFASCKKSSDTPSVPPVTTLPGSPNLTNASGAFYAIVIDALLKNGSGYDTTTINTPMAWFESTSQSKDAGTASCNAAPLVLKDTFFGTPFNNTWYTLKTDYTFTGTPLNFKGTSSIVWKASGNSANAIPAINFSDNNPFGKITGFVVPSSITYGTGGLNVSFNFSNSTGTDQLLYLIKGSKDQKAGSLTLSTTTLSLTAAEVSSLGVKGDQLEVELIPVKISSSVIGGKTYYFVKEYCINKYVDLL